MMMWRLATCLLENLLPNRWLSTAMGRERPLVGDDQSTADGQTTAGVKETQEG